MIPLKEKEKNVVAFAIGNAFIKPLHRYAIRYKVQTSLIAMSAKFSSGEQGHFWPAVYIFPSPKHYLCFPFPLQFRPLLHCFL